jgi:hypothetical protein
MGVVIVVLVIQMGALTCKPDFDLHVGPSVQDRITHIIDVREKHHLINWTN